MWPAVTGPSERLVRDVLSGEACSVWLILQNLALKHGVRRVVTGPGCIRRGDPNVVSREPPSQSARQEVCRSQQRAGDESCRLHLCARIDSPELLRQLPNEPVVPNGRLGTSAAQRMRGATLCGQLAAQGTESRVGGASNAKPDPHSLDVVVVFKDRAAVWG